MFFGFWLEFYELLIENVRRYKSHGPKKRNTYYVIRIEINLESKVGQRSET